DLSGVAFPHFRRGGSRPHSYVVRLDRPHDGMKYVCAPGEHDLYFSPGFESLLGDTTALTIFVESPKTVLALTALAERAERRWLVIGLGGCWGWRRKTGIESARTARASRLPDPIAI